MSKILTYTGRMFDLAAPNPDDVSAMDIGHALSNLCRFTGHTREFYSVAQHSVLVANLLPPELQFMGLMHDAHEAYVQDLATPLKAIVNGYRTVEQPVWEAVALRFNLPRKLPPEVRQADLIALATEKRDLMPEHKTQWPVLHGVGSDPSAIVPWTPREAKGIWLDYFRRLCP